MQGRHRRGAAAAALVLLLSPVAAGCSGDEEAPASPAPSPSSATEEPRDAELEVRAGKVAGGVRAKPRKRAVRQVGRVVDHWVDHAYAGEYPRTNFSRAFRGFTKGAERQARRQRAVMSNIGRGKKLQSVRVAGGRAIIDLVGDRKRRPAAATARVRVKLVATGVKKDRTTISGRLLLTHRKNGWKVFGFEMRRNDR